MGRVCLRCRYALQRSENIGVLSYRSRNQLRVHAETFGVGGDFAKRGVSGSRPLFGVCDSMKKARSVNVEETNEYDSRFVEGHLGITEFPCLGISPSIRNNRHDLSRIKAFDVTITI